MLFFLLRVALVLAIAIGGGAYSAMYAIDHDIGLGEVRFGLWTAHPGRGSVSDDPYSRARLARSGEIPLGGAEGMEFAAAADAAGRPLRGDCVYRVSGSVPPARFWTLHALSDGLRRAPRGGDAGAPVPTSLHSRQLMRHPDNTFDIAVAPFAQPGNWLPVAPRGGLRLVLTLYDTPVSADYSLGEVMLPDIVREGCGA